MRVLFVGFFHLLFICSAPVFAKGMTSRYEGPTVGEKLMVALVPFASRLERPTGFIAVPEQKDLFVALEQTGRAVLIYTQEGREEKKEELFGVHVHSHSELGLLGLAFHPDFAKNRLFYVNYTPKISGRGEFTRIAEWVWPRKSKTATEKRVLLEIDQPFSNHNGGDLQFGPDGYLYIGMGDGGSAGDPHEHGQNRNTLLGTMLRIDVRADGAKPYRIPANNPFVGQVNMRSEIWAYGLRNPWRYSFDPKGRLIAADVGQNAWEEISFVPKGANMGWKAYEGTHCYVPKVNCKVASGKHQEPFFEYDRKWGMSITGGFVHLNAKEKSLYQKYIFGDYVSGRIAALDLPEKDGEKIKKAYDLGIFRAQISAFGRGHDGEIYVVDHIGGRIYRLQEAPRS